MSFFEVAYRLRHEFERADVAEMPRMSVRFRTPRDFAYFTKDLQRDVDERRIGASPF